MVDVANERTQNHRSVGWGIFTDSSNIIQVKTNPLEQDETSSPFISPFNSEIMSFHVSCIVQKDNLSIVMISPQLALRGMPLPMPPLRSVFSTLPAGGVFWNAHYNLNISLREVKHGETIYLGRIIPYV